VLTNLKAVVIRLRRSQLTVKTFFKKGDYVMKFKPLRDRVFVKYSSEEEKTAGGLYIPDAAKEKPQKGTVMAVGTGKVTEDGKRQPMEVKVGNTILFDKYSGSKIKMDNEEYLIIKEEDILGIVEG
jgi:chaperonin GroES